MKYKNKSLKLAEFARELLTKHSLEDGLPLIAKYVKDVIGAERCSIFIYDAAANEVWTTLADGVKKITLRADKGLVGYTLKAKKPVVANDAYAHPEFLPEIDSTTGYITKNIITAPIFSSKREIIGVMELLNKEEGFDEEDVRFMIFFAHYVSGFLELLHTYLDQEKRVD
ncbi:GAF domain-containing protein [Sulfurimonas sp. SWIR-19]|uniref:GAF domain-containing protein n=1 Tax=Sulfurimonas sp. SWIR-19 TaxID=2878390 RepID=UPI001CF0FD15|nr:GAF domain-containing protein [Sulfurimonas sp. SWIR-19]UCN00187.1 GAF domain-containing protein [Sulfurimonas sp. SWIR-19]